MSDSLNINIPDGIFKIGFFSDLHSWDLNLISLLKQNQEIKYWFSVGDSIDMFAPKYDNAPTLRIMKKFGIKSVQGNHENYIIKNKNLEKTIGDETDLIRFFLATPFTLNIHFNPKIISLFHATPDGVSQYLSPSAALEEYEKTFRNVNSDIIVIGHSHKQFIKKLEDKIIINPGPLRDPERNFCILTRDGKISLKTLANTN